VIFNNINLITDFLSNQIFKARCYFINRINLIDMKRILMSLLHFLQMKNVFHVSGILSFLILNCLIVNIAIADNEIYSGTKVKTMPGTNIVSVKDLVLNDGANFSSTGTIVLKENLIDENLLPDLIGDVILNGETFQEMNMTGLNIIQDLEVNNGSGIIIDGETKVNGTVTLTDGIITIGSYNILLGENANFAGIPSSSSMVIFSDGGELRKTFPANFTGSFIFPVGDNKDTPDYSPVSLYFTNGTFGSENYVGVSVKNLK